MTSPTPSATSSWTGGQHSVVRFALGLWLAWKLAASMIDLPFPWSSDLAGDGSSPLGLRALFGAGALLALAFAVGWRERWCALGLAAFVPSVPTADWALHGGSVAVVLVVLALFPPAPYGSWDARGRIDPAGGWARPAGTNEVLLGLLAAILCFSALVQLVLPEAEAVDIDIDLRGPDALVPLLENLGDLLGLAFVPLLWVRRARPWIWAASFALHLYWFVPHLNGLTFLFLFAFDPAWIAPRKRRGTGEETIFYDGDCGLCHRSVRFVLAEDSAARFVFAPLQSEAFAAHAGRTRLLGDTMVLVHGDGSLAARSDAWIEILAALGGGWRLLAESSRVLPRKLRDAVYDWIASVRKRVFAKPQGLCPLLPPHLGRRFRA